MKKIFRKSNIFSFLLGAIIFGGIGVVSAYTIFANDISYTPKDTTWEVNNVKDAIDELYTSSNTTITNLQSQLNSYKNKYDSISFRLTSDGRSTDYFGRAIIEIGDFKDKYKYFTISDFMYVNMNNSATSSCSVEGYKNSAIKLESNTKYDINSSSSIELKNYSSINNQTARCYVIITFSND